MIKLAKDLDRDSKLEVCYLTLYHRRHHQWQPAHALTYSKAQFILIVVCNCLSWCIELVLKLMTCQQLEFYAYSRITCRLHHLPYTYFEQLEDKQTQIRTLMFLRFQDYDCILNIRGFGDYFIVTPPKK